VKPKYPYGTIVKPSKNKDGYKAILPDGTDVTSEFETYQLRNAVTDGAALKLTETASGDQWRKVPMSEFKEQAINAAPNAEDMAANHDKILKLLDNASSIRPASYKMDDLSWRFALRTVLRGKNMCIVGPKGTGKTVLAFTLAETLDRPLVNVPLGSTQDPRSTLIGNTHFGEGRTFVGLSEFVRAIQIPNTIILLDELSRAHPDAWNILMPVLDYKQRFLRVDEDPTTPTIQVAKGVTFIATANIGTQYTATRTLDAALLDRFITIEVGYLDKAQELDLLTQRVAGVNPKIMEAIVNCAASIRKEATGNDPRLDDGLSTRAAIEMAELIYDGFSFEQAAKLVIYPQFSEAGGTDSHRTIVKQIVQNHIPNVGTGKAAPFNLDPNNQALPWKQKK
jgi:MoxR-like ATPase